jgi:hypothetical protein
VKQVNQVNQVNPHTPFLVGRGQGGEVETLFSPYFPEQNNLSSNETVDIHTTTLLPYYFTSINNKVIRSVKRINYFLLLLRLFCWEDKVEIRFYKTGASHTPIRVHRSSFIVHRSKTKLRRERFRLPGL